MTTLTADQLRSAVLLVCAFFLLAMLLNIAVAAWRFWRQR